MLDLMQKREKRWVCYAVICVISILITCVIIFIPSVYEINNTLMGLCLLFFGLTGVILLFATLITYLSGYPRYMRWLRKNDLLDYVNEFDPANIRHDFEGKHESICFGQRSMCVMTGKWIQVVPYHMIKMLRYSVDPDHPTVYVTMICEGIRISGPSFDQFDPNDAQFALNNDVIKRFCDMVAQHVPNLQYQSFKNKSTAV